MCWICGPLREGSPANVSNFKYVCSPCPSVSHLLRVTAEGRPVLHVAYPFSSCSNSKHRCCFALPVPAAPRGKTQLNVVLKNRVKIPTPLEITDLSLYCVEVCLISTFWGTLLFIFLFCRADVGTMPTCFTNRRYRQRRRGERCMETYDL